uniref:Immunoglobulin V-set domain-containing protein n=1 Tax=Castor canadensis TaxID=51338 RepID=A0A8C0WCY4_CASCN
MCNVIHLFLFTYSMSDARYDISMTQSLFSLSASPRDRVTITFRASQGITWYQQKSGKAPKYLIHGAKRLECGIPSRFRGCRFGTEFTLTISRLEAENVTTCYCQKYNSYPHTVIQVIK